MLKHPAEGAASPMWATSTLERACICSAGEFIRRQGWKYDMSIRNQYYSELPEVWLLRRILFAALLALGIVLYVLEGLFPPLLPVPGAKLGLSNILVLFTMLFLGYKEGIFLAIARSILGSFIAGTALAPGALLSLSGGFASALVVAVSLRFLHPPLGLVGVSILGAITHNVVQLLVAYFLFIQISGLLYYLPVLLFLALGSGLVTGLIAVYLFERLQMELKPI